MLKHFLNHSQTTLKKSRKRLFRPQNGQKLPRKFQTWIKFKLKIQIFDVIYGSFELKRDPKVGSLRLKTMLKQLSNNSKITLKKSRIRLFRPPKWSKMTPQISQNEQSFDPKSQFSRSFMTFEAQNTEINLAKKVDK